jgi:hypothetical protein
VSRYLPKRPARPDKLKHCLAFLCNPRDGLVGLDFFALPTVTFKLLGIFVVLPHKRKRRRVRHFKSQILLRA